MPNDLPSTDKEPVAPVLPWRLVAGAFLHCALPFYLLAILVALVRARPVDAEALLHLALGMSPALLGGYAVAAIAATLAAALFDPLLRARRTHRQARNPRLAAERSERRLRLAIAGARAIPLPGAEAALSRLAAARWNHEDPRYQALSRDLAEAIESSIRALATATPDRRPILADMILGTIEHIASAQAELATADAREDETQARVVAGYVEARYGRSKFSD